MRGPQGLNGPFGSWAPIGPGAGYKSGYVLVGMGVKLRGPIMHTNNGHGPGTGCWL